MLHHDTVGNMVLTNFQMMQHHGYDIEYLDNIMPWERQVYIDLLIKHVAEENERLLNESKR